MFGGEYVLEGAGGCSGKKTRRKDGHEGGARGRKSGSKNKVQRKCGFDTKTNRCNRASKGHMNEWCTVGKKTKRCKKSSLGKKTSPKNPANVARGQAQMRKLKSQGKWKQKARKESTKRVPPPLPDHMLAKTRTPTRKVNASGMTCNNMSQQDCEGAGGRLMGCRWGKFGKSKKNTCGQKATASHTGTVKRPGAGRKKKKSARKKIAKIQKAGGCPPALKKLCENPNFNDPKCKKCVKPKKKCSKSLKKLCENPNFNDPSCNQCGGNQQGGAQWNYIVNPETGRTVSINGAVGQRVLRNYVNML